MMKKVATTTMSQMNTSRSRMVNKSIKMETTMTHHLSRSPTKVKKISKVDIVAKLTHRIKSTLEVKVRQLTKARPL